MIYYSRRENFLKPIRKSLDKKVKKKDGLQVSSLKQENIGTNELLEKMLIKLKNEPTNAVSYEDKVKIKNILCEVQNFASEKVIEDIKNIIHNNNITRETLSYLNENLGKFIVNKTSKVDDEVLSPRSRRWRCRSIELNEQLIIKFLCSNLVFIKQAMNYF
jgi:hypothetical protein